MFRTFRSYFGRAKDTINTNTEGYLPLQSTKEDGTSDEHTGQADHAEDLERTSQGDDESRPTKGELRTLRRVPGDIPWAALVIAIVELAERSSYYGCLGVFPSNSNFIQRPLPPGSTTGAPLPSDNGTVDFQATPGALGKGLRVASAIVTTFSLMAYLCPIGGGLIADLRLDKFRTILLGTIVGLLAHMVLVYAASPSVLLAGRGMPPFLLSLVLLSFSTGMIKSNIGPLMCDQLGGPDIFIRTLHTGEVVIVDKSLTIQRAMNLFYGCINVGALFSAATTFAEKYVGFWLAFAIPGVIFLVMPVLLYAVRPHLIVARPTGSILLDVVRIVRVVLGRGHGSTLNASSRMSKNGDRWERAKSTSLAIQGAPPGWYTWDDAFVDELKSSFHGCNILIVLVDLACSFPCTTFACLNGLSALVTSLTGSLTTNGVPNDFFISLNSLTIILAIPFLTYYLYPKLRERRIAFGPIRRVVTGFMFAATGYGYAAFLQWQVYRTSPCGYYATECHEGSGVSSINAWWTAPIPVLAGISEVLANVTGLEIAYNQAPKRLKSFVTALFLFTSAISSAIVLALIPMFKDPYLVFPFLGVSLATTASAATISWIFSDGEQGGRETDAAEDYELAGLSSEDGRLNGDGR